MASGGKHGPMDLATKATLKRIYVMGRESMCMPMEMFMKVIGLTT